MMKEFLFYPSKLVTDHSYQDFCILEKKISKQERYL